MLSKTSPSRGPGSPRVVGAYEPDSGSIQYVVADEATRKAALIDVVLDFNPRQARTSTGSARWALETLKAEGLELAWILDAHPMPTSSWRRPGSGSRPARPR